MALLTLCSQALGTRNYPLVGIWLQTSLVLMTIFSIAIMVRRLCVGKCNPPYY
jgi:Na+-driven multidrug efflux pump